MRNIPIRREPVKNPLRLLLHADRQLEKWRTSRVGHERKGRERHHPCLDYSLGGVDRISEVEVEQTAGDMVAFQPEGRVGYKQTNSQRRLPSAALKAETMPVMPSV